MARIATFLHITDTHVTGSGTPHDRDDHKDKIQSITQVTREEVLDHLLGALAGKMAEDDRRLDAVIFSGDATVKGKVDGHRILLQMLVKHLGGLGIQAGNIVAVPGNHDVPKGTEPGSRERYAAFIDTWRNAGCITPWLDGIDPVGTTTPELHRLVSPDGDWAIYPINSANWSHVSAVLKPPLSDVWDEIHTRLFEADGEKAAAVRKQLDDLTQFDMARVSGAQMEEFARVVASTPPASGGHQMRIATLHHHLSAPSLREEVKAFADFTNLELLRQVLRQQSIDVVMHGHKHEHAARWEYVQDYDGGDGRRMLVLSGATFDKSREQDAARLIAIDGMPWAPRLTTSAVAIPHAGLRLVEGAASQFRLWRDVPAIDRPSVVSGDNLDVVYGQACQVAGDEAHRGTLIVHLDLPPDTAISLPSDYRIPVEMPNGERQAWLNELVSWWQKDSSVLERRVPYIHGNRLHAYGGIFDQVARVRKMLTVKGSSRAIAILIDPLRDFTKDGDKETFASFCLVQFRKRDIGDGTSAVDVIAYYRAQEFAQWWPINVAELRSLQNAVCKRPRLRPGRITTITADARSIARSPTQVAMPLIDRWLDDEPQRIHALAIALSGTSTGSPSEAKAVEGWYQTLDELSKAASEFNGDGVPVAIEGLERLSKYIEAGNPAGSRQLRRSLDALARVNRAYERTDQEEQDFRNWGALEHVRELRELSDAILRTTSAS